MLMSSLSLGQKMANVQRNNTETPAHLPSSISSLRNFCSHAVVDITKEPTWTFHVDYVQLLPTLRIFSTIVPNHVIYVKRPHMLRIRTARTLRETGSGT